METYQLVNGLELPKIGFGTYKSADRPGCDIFLDALDAGYRLFDTASFYGNEMEIGEAIGSASVSRHDILLSSKVWKDDMGYDTTLRSFEESLRRLGTDYLDIYLIHWPIVDIASDTWRDLDRQTWKALERLYEEKLVRAIGVSNFLPHHLMNLETAANVQPMLNQIEFHPGYLQLATVDYCRKHQIQVEAWSPLGRRKALSDPLLVALAEKYQRTVAQICLRFALQLQVLPLPKSGSPERMKQNNTLFDFTLSEEDMYRLLTLPQITWSGEHPDRERVRF